MIKLTSIYEQLPNGRPSGIALQVLYDILSLRTPEQSISHKAMPSFEEHYQFVISRPYAAWYLIESEGPRVWPVGACYLTRQREIGIGIYPKHQGRGYASAAIRELMTLHRGRFLANINPANEASIALFRKLGFGGPIQITLEKP